MAKNIIVLFLLPFVICCSAFAQNDTGSLHTSVVPDSPHLRISIISGSPGTDIMETFGHICIRVTDSTVSDRGRDLIYNYGFYDERVISAFRQWMDGRVIVFIETITYDQLIGEYTDKGRGLYEQVLLLDGSKKKKIQDFLKNNMRRENRYYEYDTYYDNCTTRVRDLFEKVFGNNFVPGQILPAKSRLTFRDVSMNKYCVEQHKYLFGLVMNLFYASRADRVMSSREAMVDPVYLSDAMRLATIDGKKVCADKTTLLENKLTWPSTVNGPFLIILIISIITIAGLLVPRLQMVGKVMSFLLLTGTGVLGCYMLYFWLKDCEPAWKDNFNVFWALPTNLIIPYFSKKIKAKYAIVAMCLMGVSLVLHVFRVQEMPLFEIGSLLLALLFVYGRLYRAGATMRE